MLTRPKTTAAADATLGSPRAAQVRRSRLAFARRGLHRYLDHPQPRWHGWLWTMLLLGTLLMFAARLGAFDWYTAFKTIGPNGATVSLPNTFTDFDHPFHIAKEAATLAALRHGWLPRWYDFHQGGFPAEFYPSGSDLVVVATYLLALGKIPLAVVHKLVLIGVFFLPPLAIWEMTRRDRFPLSLALVAAILHLGVPGQWVGGGGTGLFMTGLWPDIFGTYLTLFLVLWGADYLRFGSRRGLVLAAGCGALAVYSNPRSLVAIGTMMISVALVALYEARHAGDDAADPLARASGRELPHGSSEGSAGSARRGWLSRSRRLLQVEVTGSGCWWAVLLRGALLGGVLLLLCAALLVPLHAHQASYHFTFYTAFTHWYDVARFYARAVPLPIIGLAVIGFPLALRRGFYARTLALTVPVSIVVISLTGWYLRHLSIFAQLEGGRLISMLRVPTLFLAAFALHELLRLLLRYLRLPSATLVSGLLAVCLTAALVVSPHSPLPASDRGLPKIVTTDQPAFADVAASAYNMERLTTPADRALVLADPIAMHTSIWIPALTGRPAYFGDWLWSWRDYPYGYEDRFRDWSQGLDANWLRENGITVVMVARTAPDLMDLAERAPYLVMLDPGNGSGYAIFRVNLPDLSNGWVNVAGGTVDGVQVGPERLSAQLHAPTAGVARVAINAYPGWQAVVNGHAVPVTRSADGFMEVPVPAGNSSLILRYTTSGVVWLGRGLTAAGVLLLLVLVLLPRWVRRPAEVAPAPWPELVETEA